ncbi:MAG: HesA/MoeB/ThiF family protein [Candidatus Helarchaeota archaeon]
MIPIEERTNLALEAPKMFSRIIFMGYDINQLLSKTALVCGAGGLGVIVAEILARTGLGKIIIIDKDIVEEENFNRLVYTRDDIKKPKALTLAEKLRIIRNEKNIDKKFHLQTEAYKNDIIAWPKLEELIEQSDVIFTCFDNEDARIEVNAYAVQQKKPIFDGGTSENALRGIVISVIPGVTPCLECYYSPDTLVYIEPDKNEDSIPRLPCGASLATTMNIVASLQVDQGFKYILNYGQVVPKIRISLEDEVVIQNIFQKKRPNCEACGNL